MARQSKIKQLLVKRLRGKLSEKEQEELENWARESPEHQVFLETRMRPEAFAEWQAAFWDMDEGSLDRKIERALRRSPFLRPYIRKRQTSRVLKWGLAPTACLIGALLLLWPPGRGYSKNRTEEVDHYLKRTNKPPKTGQFAVAGHLPISLDSWEEGETFRSGNLDFVKGSERRLAVRWKDRNDHHTESAVSSSLSIPGDKNTINIKQNWELTLPDSSRVSLYPGSSISISINALGTTIRQRVMILNGQAFFDISHDPHAPLFIETTRSELKVCGTIFNVRDFGAEDTLSVSLYRGKLSINNSRKTRNLYSLHRASIRTGSNIVVGDVPIYDERIVVPLRRENGE